MGNEIQDNGVAVVPPKETVQHIMPAEDTVFRLEVPQVTWWKDPGLRKLYLMFPILFIASTIKGYDGSLLNGLQTMEPWRDQFGHPQGSTIGLFTAILQIGSFSALPVSPYIADKFGRRLGVAVGCVVIIIGAILQVVPSVNRGMFLGGRFLVGLGSNISEACAPILISELAHPQHRGKVTTMFNTLWFLGSIIAAWTVFGTTKYKTSASWKIPVGIQAALPAFQLFACWLLPESPRWLIAQDRDGEAFKILAKYHANGDEQSQFVKDEFLEVHEAIRLEKLYSNQGWMVLLQTPGNRKRVMLILMTAFFSQCSGNGLVSYYIHSILTSIGIEGSTDQSLINGGLQIWSLIVAVSFSLMVDKMGRRKLFLSAGIGMLVTFSIWTACSAVYAETGNTNAGSTVIAMIFCYYGMAGFAWPGLTIGYCAEILPYNIRAKGLSLTFAGVAVASILNQYVNPIGLQHLAWKFYIVYIVILVIECLCIYFFYVETRGSSLEELAVLFDGEDSNVAGKHGTMGEVMKAREESDHIEQA
ncbi:hypothetical protein A1O1_08845 [Capronia coronata CBS 617.96]|uniref:Major facilitator superfamily (MFS) profile domain-containing protein n=1 Tax=Capronia coronata CBS 617.96 TaxID=1182541 RepID=W9XM98_9EURO|nr:uncharacterized protein A1O1_08845 [Capronia coronata CBS 617.96]EXJ78445.1 hypothetical protein A1O1_08845 [Capronia coronata CBS 617.96]